MSTINIPSFSKIPEAENKNFETSRNLFEEILTWAERLKQILHIKRVDIKPGPIEYYQLVHILGNAFINSVLILMKGYIFHSYAIVRLGLESFFQLAIIETQFSEHLNVWKNYNYSNSKSENWKDIKKSYNDIFRYKRNKHDYSKFLDLETKEILIHRWKFLSEYGSHVNFMQTIFSFNIKNIENKQLAFSNLFDVNNSDKNSLGINFLWTVDTFFHIANSLSIILENHKVYLYRSSEDIQKMWNEWVEFKINKGTEFGINVDDYI